MVSTLGKRSMIIIICIIFFFSCSDHVVRVLLTGCYKAAAMLCSSGVRTHTANASASACLLCRTRKMERSAHMPLFFYSLLCSKACIMLQQSCTRRWHAQCLAKDEQGHRCPYYGQLGWASLGKSRQVGGKGKSWRTSHWQLGWASLGKSRQVGDKGKS